MIFRPVLIRTIYFKGRLFSAWQFFCNHQKSLLLQNDLRRLSSQNPDRPYVLTYLFSKNVRHLSVSRTLYQEDGKYLRRDEEERELSILNAKGESVKKYSSVIPQMTYNKHSKLYHPRRELGLVEIYEKIYDLEKTDQVCLNDNVKKRLFNLNRMAKKGVRSHQKKTKYPIYPSIFRTDAFRKEIESFDFYFMGRRNHIPGSPRNRGNIRNRGNSSHHPHYRQWRWFSTYSTIDLDNSGDDPNTPGDDLETSGDDLHTSGDDLDSSGNDLDNSGDDPDTSGDDLETSGDDLDISRDDLDISTDDTVESSADDQDIFEDIMEKSGFSKMTDEEIEDFYGDTEEKEQISEWIPPIDSTRGKMGVFDIDQLVILLKEQKAQDICVIKLPEHLQLADYMVIASGKSSRQTVALMATVQYMYKQKKNSQDPFPRFERDQREWLAAHLGNIVLHVMSEETRRHYNLETLWTMGYGFEEELVDDQGMFRLSDSDLDWLKEYKDLDPADGRDGKEEKEKIDGEDISDYRRRMMLKQKKKRERKKANKTKKLDRQ